jgi:DNA adenine methylase
MIASPAKPFLKWAGGKSQLIQTLAGFFPPEMRNEKTRKYIEPFNDVR